MIGLTIVLGTIAVLTSTGLFFSIRKNMRDDDRLDQYAEMVDQCVAALEVCHDRLDKKSKMELFLDEPVVREMVSDLADAKSAVMQVAQVLDASTEIEEEEDDAQ